MAHVKSGSFDFDDGIFLYQTDEDGNPVQRIGGPYPSNDAADEASRAASKAVGERPVEDYIKFLQDKKPPLESLLDFFITPISKEQDRVPRMLPVEEEPSLFNVATDFITDIEYDPESFRVPVNPDYTHYPADMSGVKFGDVLPERNKIEGLILEASGNAGVDPQYTEGHRTEEQNKLVGGHPKSKHLTGQAFDLAISGDSRKDRAYEKELERLFHPLGFSVVLKKDHIHLQKPPPGQ